MRSATEIAAYRALSESVCAEIEDQESLGQPPCVPTVGSAYSGPVSGKTKRQDLHGSGGLAADLSIDNTAVAGQRNPPRTLGVVRQERHPTGGVIDNRGHDHDAGVSDDGLRTGTTFLTAVQQPEGQHLQRIPIPAGGTKNSAGHDTPTISQPAVVEYGATTTDSDGETQSATRETLSDLSGPRNTSTKTRNFPAEPIAPGSDSRVVRSGGNGIAADRRSRRGPERLWDQGQSPSGSLDKHRVTITSAR